LFTILVGGWAQDNNRLWGTRWVRKKFIEAWLLRLQIAHPSWRLIAIRPEFVIATTSMDLNARVTDISCA
jgi:hypothetical protein